MAGERRALALFIESGKPAGMATRAGVKTVVMTHLSCGSACGGSCPLGKQPSELRQITAIGNSENPELT